MDKFIVVPNLSKDIDLKTTKYIIDYIEANNKNVYLEQNIAVELERIDIGLEDSEITREFIDCIIVLGGDGTILSTARKFSAKDIPLLGVNLGRLGFLAEVEKEDALYTIDKLFKDDYKIEKRMMIECEIERNGVIQKKEIALNDAVITKGAFSRMLDLCVSINGEFVDVFTADGIIISTPTGSTAYNISAGGPIMVPSAQTMVITPICSHSLKVRSIVVSKDDVVTVKVTDVDECLKKDIMLTIDGQVGFNIDENCKINISKSQRFTKLLKTSKYTFYDILRKKL